MLHKPLSSHPALATASFRTSASTAASSAISPTSAALALGLSMSNAAFSSSRRRGISHHDAAGIARRLSADLGFCVFSRPIEEDAKDEDDELDDWLYNLKTMSVVFPLATPLWRPSTACPRSTSGILGARTVFVNTTKRSISPRAITVKVDARNRKKKGKDTLDGKENFANKVPTLT
ncbi:hypothetical protein B0H13DRAFT_2292675 [Mycena leptocephala]|nr:hypothetical protein B0H13DRAFT_2292675 [Mycena leptocephala]